MNIRDLCHWLEQLPPGAEATVNLTVHVVAPARAESTTPRPTTPQQASSDKAVCATEGCGRESKVKGLCSRCYQRFRQQARKAEQPAVEGPVVRKAKAPTESDGVVLVDGGLEDPREGLQITESTWKDQASSPPSLL